MKGYNKSIGIVVTNYNYSHFLRPALISIKKQDYKSKINVYMIDDCSKKSDQKRFIKIAKEFNSIIKWHHIMKKNKGVSSARNHALKQVDDHYIMFLDADDKLESNYISSGIKLLKKGYDIVFTELKMFGKERGLLGISKRKHRKYNLIKANFISCSAICKRRIFDYEQFDENMKTVEDCDLWLRLVFLHNVKYKFNKNSKLLYRRHDTYDIKKLAYTIEQTRYFYKKLKRRIGQRGIGIGKLANDMLMRKIKELNNKNVASLSLDYLTRMYKKDS